jgi:hypothetical protein
MSGAPRVDMIVQVILIGAPSERLMRKARVRAWFRPSHSCERLRLQRALRLTCL